MLYQLSAQEGGREGVEMENKEEETGLKLRALAIVGLYKIPTPVLNKLVVKFSSLKEQTFMTSQFLWVRNPGIAYLSPWLRVCHRAVLRVSAWAADMSMLSWGVSLSKLTH